MSLTRRRMDNDFESWVIMLEDIRVGTISQRAGIPLGEPPWEWYCGFYPGCGPGQHTDGIADTFDEARAEFQEAWDRLSATLSADAFDKYREWQAADTGTQSADQGRLGAARVGSPHDVPVRRAIRLLESG
jgi:hypothetical protein